MATTKSVLISIYNAAIVAYPRMESYVDLSVPEPQAGTGDALAEDMANAIASISPTSGRDLEQVLDASGVTELYDTAARRLTYMIDAITTVKAAIIAARVGSSITLQA